MTKTMTAALDPIVGANDYGWQITAVGRWLSPHSLERETDEF
jgi:hypothetical protein